MANIGIDLGTTHSLVAVVLGGKPRVLLDDDERALLPSAVRVGDDGVPKSVGYPAIAAAGEAGGTTFTSFKRFMGRGASDVAEEAALYRYDLVDDDDGMVRFRVGPRTINPLELSSFVLRLLHARAEECLFARPAGAVITVPAYFDDAQRQATRDAARVAGIEVLRLLNEPTAAALAYGLNTAQDGQRVAVYDLGGGTFDISILELSDGFFQVLSTAGDTQLGGDDFDQALAALLLQQAGVTDADGPTFRAAVMAAERAKRALTDAESTLIEVELAGQAVEAGIDRSTFEQLIKPIVERTRAACLQALSDAELTAADVDEVVLVGGSTRVPLVRHFVGELFGRTPHCDLDPDKVVALGAAIQADLLTGHSELSDDLLLVDVVPLSLGVEMMGGTTERIIPRTSSIPATASQTFTTHVDDQTHVELHVVQGEREMARHNRSLARFKLGIPPMPAGMPRVKVEFDVDADGILTVSAVEEHTGATATVDVRPTYGLSDDEVEQMLDDAIDNAEEDIDERLLIDARVEGEQILHSLRKALTVDADLLDSGEGDAFVALADDLEAALGGTDRRRIQSLGEKLDQLTAPFAQRRIERDLARAIHGRMADNVAEVLQ
ncbi:MAG: Fe-S protein assembly chaperone HscA [Phycisphaerae bacterium]|nr:Fe-S protein assembly chaperone HscA [Phycisphaerae bacterium]